MDGWVYVNFTDTLPGVTEEPKERASGPTRGEDYCRDFVEIESSFPLVRLCRQTLRILTGLR